MATAKLLTLIVLVTLSSVASDVMKLDDSCLTEYHNGTCKVITSCQFAMSILVNGELKLLKNLFCGFQGRDPMVCCPFENSKTKITYVDPEEIATRRPTNKPKATTNRPETTTRAIRTTMATVKPVKIDVLPNRSICGQDVDGDRIYGGNIAKLDEFPWLARIKYIIGEKELYGCSGSLITNRYVLTAAHCASGKITEVRLGEWDVNSDTDCFHDLCNDNPLDVIVEEVIVFPEYNAKTFKGDIALLRLQQAVNFTDFIQPICLPTTEYVAMQDYVRESSYMTAGWGMTELESVSVVKRKVSLNAVPIDVCRNAIVYISESTSPYVICAGGRKGEDSCRGDSGGPLTKLVMENYKFNWYIYGITSYGSKNCGTEGIPGIYTRITSFMTWILQNIKP